MRLRTSKNIEATGDAPSDRSGSEVADLEVPSLLPDISHPRRDFGRSNDGNESPGDLTVAGLMRVPDTVAMPAGR